VPPARYDVLVAGAGPAGRAIALACARRGLRTAVADPAPDRPWRATYGAWADELIGLAALTGHAVPVAGTAAAVAHGYRRHRLDRDYQVLDTGALRRVLITAAGGGVTEHRGRVTAVRHTRTGSTVALAGAGELAAAVVVDATGARRRPGRPRAEQTAFGVILDAAAARPVLPAGQAVVMDWRPAAATGPDWPTFLYAVPLGGGRVLLEETCLARRPGLGTAVLRERLAVRLARSGIGPDALAGAPRERVRFPVDDPVRRPGRVVPFGAAAPLVHPATGYSVAAALRLAPGVAGALAAGLGTGPAAGPVRAAAAGWWRVWPPRALAVQALRRRGLAVLLGLPPAVVPAFFDAFLELPAGLQRGYLSGRDDLAGTAAAMTALVRQAPPDLRRRIVRLAAGPAGR
jgi:lycopene beta-cyclase